MKLSPIPPLLPKGAEFTFGKSPFRAKGVLYLGTQAFFAEHHGFDALLLGMEEPELREFISQRFLAASYYDVSPVPTLIAYEARALRMSVESYLLHRTRFQANKDLGGVYAWLLRLASPPLIARHLPRIMMQMFDFATVEILREEPNETWAKMSGIPMSLAPWLEVGLSVYAETALRLAGTRATTTTSVKPAGVRAGLPLVELTVSLRRG